MLPRGAVHIAVSVRAVSGISGGHGYPQVSRGGPRAVSGMPRERDEPSFAELSLNHAGSHQAAPT